MLALQPAPVASADDAEDSRPRFTAHVCPGWMVMLGLHDIFSPLCCKAHFRESPSCITLWQPCRDSIFHYRCRSAVLNVYVNLPLDNAFHQFIFFFVGYFSAIISDSSLTALPKGSVCGCCSVLSPCFILQPYRLASLSRNHKLTRKSAQTKLIYRIAKTGRKRRRSKK